MITFSPFDGFRFSPDQLERLVYILDLAVVDVFSLALATQ